MLRITEALVIVIVYLLLAPFARGQTLNGKLLRLNPTALPTMCAIGDLRVDSGDSYKLKLCNALNTWAEITPTGALIDPMTTTGDLISRSGGIPVRIAAGTSGYLLTANGAGVLPSWQTAPVSLPTGGTAGQYLRKSSVTNFDAAWSAIPQSEVTNLVSDLALKSPLANPTFTGTVTGTFSGNLTGNVTGNVSGSSGSSTGNAATATALAANPTDCGSNTKATAIDASGNLTCSSVANADLAGSIAASKLIGSDIATVGTITSGTWSGTAIAETKGGTNQTSYTLGDILYASATNVLSKLGIGATNQVMTVTSGIPSWKTVQDFNNLMTNGGLEDGGSSPTGWTSSGGTFSNATSGANYMGIGNQSGTWDSSSASQTLTSPAYTVGNGYAGTNGLFRCKVRTPSGTATHTMGLWDGTTLTDTITIPSSTTAQYVEISKPFGAAASTIAIRFTSVNANEPLISIDDCYIGRNFNIGDLAQAKKLGSIKWAGATNCAWTSSSTSFGNYSADTDCSTPSVTGSVTAPGTKIPAAVLSSLPAGNILLVASGAFYKAGTVDAAVQFRFSDGTNTSTPVQIYAGTGVGPSTTIVGSFDYSVSQGSTTFNIQGRTGSASNFVNIAADNSGNTELQIDVYYYPTQNQTVARADNADFDWTSFTPTGSWVSNTTYTGKFRRTGDTMEIQYNLALTGAPTAASLTLNLPSGYTIDTTKLLTSTSGVTYLESDGTLYDTGSLYYPKVTALYNSTTSVVLYYSIIATHTGNAPILTAVVNSTGPFTWGNTDQVQLTVKVPIVGWQTSQRAPLLVGSVTSNSSGLERIERALVTISGASACAVTSQSGSWLTGCSASGSQATLTVAAGIFSGAPTCTCMGTGVVVNGICRGNGVIPTSTSIGVGVYSTANVAQNDSLMLICMGPR